MRLPLLLVALLAAAPAAAHVSLWPKQSAAGGREKYEVRVPNEKSSDTIAVEIRVPAGVRVTSVEQKPGWLTEPSRDPSGKIIGVRWTGRLAPGQFAEFGLLAVNLSAAEELVWPAVQRFADGTQIEWSGDKGSKTPAPRVTLVRAGAARSVDH